MMSRQLYCLRCVSDRFVEKIKTHILCLIFPPPGKRAVYEVMWKIMVQPDRPQMTILYGAENKQFACRITKARIQTQSHNVQYLLLFCSNSCYINVTPYYVVLHCLSCKIIASNMLGCDLYAT
jgi:hypothetical protein